MLKALSAALIALSLFSPGNEFVRSLPGILQAMKPGT